MKTENLKLRKEILGSWSVTQQIIIYKDELSKNLQMENRSPSCQRMAFKHHISFATDLAANFGCY